MSKYILFDLDGTLTNSSPGIINSILFALDKMGIHENDETKLRSFVGPPLVSTFREHYFPDSKDQVEAIKHYRSYFSTKGIYENSLYAGVIELLETIKSNGGIMALATAKPTYFANIILKHFQISSYFDVVVGSHLDGGRTTKKEIIHEVLDQLGDPRPEKCTMVGDREYDVLGAKFHGLNTIAVTYGYAKELELEAAAPDSLVDTPLALAKIICT